MPDQSRARLHKAIAAVISESRPAAALNHYTFALQLDPRCGVKKTKSGWSAICVTATNGTCPRTGGTGWRQALPYQNPVHRPLFQEKTRMKFVAPEQAPEQAEVIKNTPFWPDVDLSEFRSVMRTDGTVTSPRLKQLILSAMSEVNAELYTSASAAGAGVSDAGRRTGGRAGRQKRASTTTITPFLLGACPGE
jgi:hypothetical protein